MRLYELLAAGFLATVGCHSASIDDRIFLSEMPNPYVILGDINNDGLEDAVIVDNKVGSRAISIDARLGRGKPQGGFGKKQHVGVIPYYRNSKGERGVVNSVSITQNPGFSTILLNCYFDGGSLLSGFECHGDEESFESRYIVNRIEVLRKGLSFGLFP